jgi:hypothetical protein
LQRPEKRRRLRTADEVGIPCTTLLARMKRFNIATRDIA